MKSLKKYQFFAGDAWGITEDVFFQSPNQLSRSLYYSNLRMSQIDSQNQRKTKNALKTVSARQTRYQCSQSDIIFTAPHIDPEPPQPICDATPLTQVLLEQMLKNLSVPKNCRRYDDTFYDVSWILFLTSPRCYNILRQILPFPSKTSLCAHYSDQLEAIRYDIAHLEGLVRHVRQYYETFHHKLSRTGRRKIIGTLGVDAFTFRSFTGAKPGAPPGLEQRYSSAFIMVFTPLLADIPTRSVHLMPHTSGAHDSTVAERVQNVRKVLEENGCRVWFKATDGDVGLSKEHTAFFRKHIPKRAHNFAALVQWLDRKLEKDEDFYLPIADPLHVLKNMRARLMTHTIAVVTSDPDTFHTTNIQTLREVLHLGNVLTDETQIGKMRDAYAVKLFTFENFCGLAKAEEYELALLFFPFCCWTAVIWQENLASDMRWVLIETAFQVLMRLLEESEYLQTFGVKQRGRGEIVVAIETGYLYRIINSLIAFGISIAYQEGDMRFGALGTHIVENIIGLARQDSSDPRWERILAVFAHIEHKKRLAELYSIVLYVSGRVNDAGCKGRIDSDAGAIGRPSDWNVVGIVDMLFGCCKDDSPEVVYVEMADFCDQLGELFVPLRVYDREVNATANELIISRLMEWGGSAL